MKISEVIQQLEEYKAKHGDVELHAEHGDGRSTWAEPLRPSIEFREIWPGHPGGEKHFLRP